MVLLLLPNNAIVTGKPTKIVFEVVKVDWKIPLWPFFDIIFAKNILKIKHIPIDINGTIEPVINCNNWSWLNACVIL